REGGRGGGRRGPSDADQDLPRALGPRAARRAARGHGVSGVSHSGMWPSPLRVSHRHTCRSGEALAPRQRRGSTARPRLASRRAFLLATAGAAVSAAAPRPRSFGLAYTSFVIRMLRGRDVLRQGNAAGLPAETLLELCQTFGAAGCQMDIGQLGAAEPARLAA